jgi:hypothetical protein
MSNKALCEAYLNGDENARQIIDTIVKCAVDLSYARSVEISWDTLPEGNYQDFRQDIDEAIDSLEPIFPLMSIYPSLDLVEATEEN